MDRSDFEKQLKDDGFQEIEFQELAPRSGKGRHRHLFEIRGLVVAGKFVVKQSGDPVAYGPGEIFSVADGELHDEWIEAEGTQVLVGRKFSEARAKAAG